MSKIYIIGPVGSGKTTLAKELSNKLKIKHYELDKVVWKETKNGDVKRQKEEIEKLFNKIINKNNWIIEDVGREIFKEGIKKADLVIYLKLSKNKLKLRIITRWIKQKLKIEKTSYKANLKMLFQMFKWCNNDLEKRETLISELQKVSKKLIILTEKTLNNKDELYHII